MRLAGSAALPTRNILVRQMRFRGTGDVQLGSFDIGGGVSDVMISNVSAAFGGAYGLSLAPVFSGEVNDPIRRITIQSSIVGLVHVYGQWARFGSSNVQGEFGGCSNSPSTRCCAASRSSCNGPNWIDWVGQALAQAGSIPPCSRS